VLWRAVRHVGAPSCPHPAKSALQCSVPHRITHCLEMTQTRRPRSIKELSEYSVVPFSTRFSITAYCRSVDSLYKQATVYSSEGNLEDAFIQAAKAAQVAIANLPRHPDWRTLSADKREDITRRSNDIVSRLAVWDRQLTPSTAGPLVRPKAETLRCLRSVVRRPPRLPRAGSRREATENQGGGQPPAGASSHGCCQTGAASSV
jgi:hypothetical protein